MSVRLTKLVTTKEMDGLNSVIGKHLPGSTVHFGVVGTGWSRLMNVLIKVFLKLPYSPDRSCERRWAYSMIQNLPTKPRTMFPSSRVEFEDNLESREVMNDRRQT